MTESSKEKIADDSKIQLVDAEVTSENVMNHIEAMQLFRDSLAEIIIGDPFLNDLHTSVTLEELQSLISLEHGQAITVNVMRGDGVILPIVVLHDATVLDFRKAFQRHMVLKQTRENHTTHISWGYFWKSYWFYYNGQKLDDINMKLKDYGIYNNDTVTFIKKLRVKKDKQLATSSNPKRSFKRKASPRRN